MRGEGLYVKINVSKDQSSSEYIMKILIKNFQKSVLFFFASFWVVCDKFSCYIVVDFLINICKFYMIRFIGDILFAKT